MANAVTPQGLAGACSILLSQAKELVGDNYQMNLGRKLGALDFITDRRNAGGIKAEYISTQGGKKVVQAKLLYKQRSLPCEVKSGANAMIAGLCDTATTPLEKSVTMTINDRVFIGPKAFKNSDLVQICQDSTAWIQEYLMSDQRAMRERLDERILAKISVGRGVNNRQDGNQTTSLTNSGYTRYSLLGYDSAGNKIPLLANWNDVKMDYQNNQFNGSPAFIGQGNLQTAFELAGYACCNSSTPYDNALMKAGGAFYLDQAANNILGIPATKVTRALMVAYGASHLLWFNENRNISINTEIIQHLVLPDPVYPQLKWDVDFKWDECAKSYTYSQSAYFDVFNAFQPDSFKVDSPSPNCDDELYGETGIWGYEFQSV